MVIPGKHWKVYVSASVGVLVLAGLYFGGLLPDFNRPPHIVQGTPSVSSGLKAEVVATGLNKPRVLAFDPQNRLIVSELGANQVTILEQNSAGGLDGRILVGGLNAPHGLAFYTDTVRKITYLYVAESNRVVRYVYNVREASVETQSVEVIANFPTGGRHTTRTIGFGPNFRTQPIIKGYLEQETQLANKLYISVGSSCDACVEDSWKRAAILEADPAGTFLAEFAGGLRNSVFFAFHPVTGELWATEMGRDGLGDNLPPDEINIVRVARTDDPFGARRYGWPFCYGDQVLDQSFKPAPYTRIDIPTDCGQTEPAHIEIPAHSAPLGLAFITSDVWPKDWQNNLLVAYHGSWNRSDKTGYKVVRYILDNQGKVIRTEDFLNWLDDDGNVTGRPVDVKFDNTGALYITDDSTGVIYRVTPE